MEKLGKLVKDMSLFSIGMIFGALGLIYLSEKGMKLNEINVEEFDNE